MTNMLVVFGTCLFSASVIAQSKLYWNGTADATWNDDANWISFDIPTEEFGPGIIPSASTFAYFDNYGPSNSLGNLGINQSALGLIFEDLTSDFTLGDLSESATLSIGTGGITLAETTGPDIGVADAIINSHLIVSVAQSWFNQTSATLAAAGNVTLLADLKLLDDTNSIFNPAGSFVIGSEGKYLLNSGGNRVLEISDTGAATELVIESDIHLTESTTIARRFTINTGANTQTIINGDILNGAGAAAASGLIKEGVGTLIINGNLNYTMVGTAGGADSGTVIRGGAGSVTTIYGNINNGAQTWTVTGGNASGTTATTTLNLASSSITSTGSWVVGTTTRMNFIREGTMTLNMGAWDVRTDARINTGATTILTGTTGGWTFGSANAASTSAQINVTNAVNLTTGAWSLTGSGTGHQINIGNATNVRTGAWNLQVDDAQINWTGAGDITLTGAITMGTTSGTVSTNINLNSNATLALGGGITANASGSHQISQGTITLNATRTITVGDSAADDDLIISSNLTNGAAASGITKSGNGTLVLAGSNSFTGATTITVGRLVLDHRDNNDAKIANTTLALQGGILELRGNLNQTTVNVSGLDLSADGSSRIRLIPAGSASTTLNVGPITRSAARRTLHFEIPANTQVNTSTANTGFLGGWATMNDGTTDYFAAISEGKITAASTFAANDLTRSWSPTLTNQNISDNDGFVGTTDYMSVNSLRIGGANSLTVLERLHLTSGGLLITEDSTSSGIHGGVISAGTTNELIIHHYGSQDFTISSSLQRINDSGLGGIIITKAGDGTLVLSGRNFTGRREVYAASGQIQINEGVLAVSGGEAISNNTTVTLDNRASAIFRLLDDETIGNLETGSGSIVDLGSNTLTIRLSSNTEHAGTLVGDANSKLIKENNVIATSANRANNFNITAANNGFLGSVEVSGGLLQLSGGGGTLLNASSITLNRWGSMLLDNNTSNSNRLGDNVTLILNGANGAANAAPTLLRGLWIRTSQNSTVSEVAGNLILRGGSNYFIAEATGTTGNSQITITVSSITRENHATFTVRGTNLGTSTTSDLRRARLLISTNGNEDEAFGNLFRVGGTFANGATAQNTQANNGSAKNISIVPWIIGEVYSGGQLSDIQTPGNSFVTYNASWGSASNLGFRPLDLANEYNTYDVAGAADNVRINQTASIDIGSGKTINSLIINNQNNSTTAITVTGSGTLHNHTGAFLFTSVGAVNATPEAAASINATRGAIVFNQESITTGSGEYLMFANNLATAGTTINANLTSEATLTKSGIGLLVLTGNNTSLTDIYINEGALRIHDLDNIGGNTGRIILAGGTLELSNTYSATDHLTDRTISVQEGNEGRLAIAQGNSIQVGTISAENATFIKGGGGILNMVNGAVINAKVVIVEHNTESSANLGINPQMVLDNADGVVAINGDLQIGHGISSGGTNGSAVVHLRSNEQITDTAVVSFNATTSLFGYLSLLGHTETVAGIVAGDNSGAAIQNAQDSNNTVDGLLGHLILAGDGDYYYGGRIRDYATGAANAQGRVAISKTGSGVQTLAGEFIVYTGDTTVSGGLLRLRDAINFNSVVTNDADLELETTVSNWNYTRAINGSGNLKKTGTGTTTLSAVSNYSGTTDIDSGTLTLTAAGSINNSRAINIKHGATFNVSAKGTSGYSYGHILSGGGTVNGSINLTTGGSIRPGASSGPSVDATTGDQLGALTITGNFGLVGGSARLQISAATLNDAGVAAAFTAGGATFTDYLSNNASTWDSTAYTDANGVPKHDYIDISGTLTWNGGSIISYTANTGYNPSVGDILNLWDWTTLNGTYQLNPDTLGINSNYQRGGGLIGDLELPNFDGILYDLSLFESHGIAVVVMIPEPSKGILLLLGLSALLLRRRRQGTA